MVSLRLNCMIMIATLLQFNIRLPLQKNRSRVVDSDSDCEVSAIT